MRCAKLSNCMPQEYESNSVPKKINANKRIFAAAFKEAADSIEKDLKKTAES